MRKQPIRAAVWLLTENRKAQDSNFNTKQNFSENLLRSLAPCTHEIRDVSPLSLLEKPLHYKEIQQNLCLG